MINYVEQLTQLLPPPPGQVARPPWELSPEEVGFSFPADYRAFADSYGNGYIASRNSLRFRVRTPTSVPGRPGAPVGFSGLVDWHTSRISPLFSGWSEGEWGGRIYPMHPEPEGLLTWGENEQGDLFWWLMEGNDPDAWPVIVWARGPATTYRFNFGMAKFLYSMLSGDDLGIGFGWIRSSQTRWTLTSDWLQRRI
ncbi:hypothetical protein ACIP98_39290 [Streptomyces sp. NPDC088354]|uniref:hypothetical protein n=1 Tax=Streptomyces sp. NPDC088354 TaxID=3365856 RepID=UPI00382E7931